VLNSIASCEKSKQVQQANLFERQTLTFNFSTHRPNPSNYLSYHTLVKPHERIDCCDRCIGRRNNTAAAGSSSSTILS